MKPCLLLGAGTVLSDKAFCKMNLARQFLLLVLGLASFVGRPPSCWAGGVLLQTASQPGGNILLSWTNAPGRAYLTEYKTNLTQMDWTILGGTISVTNSNICVTQAVTPLSPEQFFRIWILTTNAADTTKPTVTVTAPTAGQLWSNLLFTARGTAKDNKKVAAVFYRLSNNSWAAATTTNVWTNWT